MKSLSSMFFVSLLLSSAYLTIPTQAQQIETESSYVISAMLVKFSLESLFSEFNWASYVETLDEKQKKEILKSLKKVRSKISNARYRFDFKYVIADLDENSFQERIYFFDEYAFMFDENEEYDQNAENILNQAVSEGVIQALEMDFLSIVEDLKNDRVSFDLIVALNHLDFRSALGLESHESIYIHIQFL